MDNKTNLTQLVQLFSKESGMPRSAAEDFTKAFFDIIADNVLAGETVKIKGFGTFRLAQMGDRESVNVNTGERFIIAGHSKISFTPDPVLKEEINKPFAGFEIISIPADVQLDDIRPEFDTEGLLAEAQADAAAANAEAAAPVEETPAIDSISAVADDGTPAEVPAEEPVKATPVKPKGRKFAKALLYILITLLILLLISFCLWPVNLLHRMRIGMDRLEIDENRNGAVDVEQVEIARLGTVDNDTVAVSPEEIADSTAKTAPVQARPSTPARTASDKADAAPTKEEKRAARMAAAVEKRNARIAKANERQAARAARKAEKAAADKAAADKAAADKAAAEKAAADKAAAEKAAADKAAADKAAAEKAAADKAAADKAAADKAAAEKAAAEKAAAEKAAAEKAAAEKAAAEKAAAKKASEEKSAAGAVKVAVPANIEAKGLETITTADTTAYRMSGSLGTHTFASGETLTKVALKWYGSKKLWPYIAAYNHITNPGAVKVGQKLRIPELKAK